MQTGFQATKDLGDPAGIFMGERKYFFCILAPSHHGYQFPQYFYFSLAPSPILKDLWNFEVRVGWFTLVNHCWLVYPCREFSMMLNISHSPLQTDMKGGNHCQNEKILALGVPQQKKVIFFNFFYSWTFILSYCCCCK